MTETLAWHFVGATLRGSTRIPDDGVPLKFEGEIAICRSGLHASERILDALRYAPGNTLCRVVCRDIGERHSDKFVCRERTILWRINGEAVLRPFSRRVALDVIHLWDAPDIAKRYLETGDESIRAATESVAWVTAEAVVGAAASGAARAAAQATARAAAGAAARAAAWAAAGAAARARAGAAAGAEAGAEAWGASVNKYNDWLAEMVEAAHAAACDATKQD